MWGKQEHSRKWIGPLKNQLKEVRYGAKFRLLSYPHIISLHGVVTLFDFHLCAIPGIDTLVQGTTVSSLIRQTLFVFTTFLSVPWPGSNNSRIVSERPAGQDSRKWEQNEDNDKFEFFWWSLISGWSEQCLGTSSLTLFWHRKQSKYCHSWIIW
jgi:hypothetical protein